VGLGLEGEVVADVVALLDPLYDFSERGPHFAVDSQHLSENGCEVRGVPFLHFFEEERECFEVGPSFSNIVEVIGLEKGKVDHYHRQDEDV
jgi:hypothetical protein